VDYAVEGVLEGRRVLLAANGAGPELAARAVEVAVRAVTAAELSASRLEAVISVGYCGALAPDLRENTIVIATEVLDRVTGAAFPCVVPLLEADVAKGKLISQNRVAVTLQDKAELAGTGAIAVDMESSGAAARTQRAGLPFLCIKVVLDRADEMFHLDLNAMRTREGRMNRGRIVAYAVTHPWLFPELLRLKRRAAGAATALGEFLVTSRIDFGQNIAPADTLASE
jgi:adenosylhomocysteine nucleosidase